VWRAARRVACGVRRGVWRAARRVACGVRRGVWRAARDELRSTNAPRRRALLFHMLFNSLQQFCKTC